MDYFQEHMRWKTGQRRVSGKKDPNQCVQSGGHSWGSPRPSSPEPPALTVGEWHTPITLMSVFMPMDLLWPRKHEWRWGVSLPGGST